MYLRALLQHGHKRPVRSGECVDMAVEVYIIDACASLQNVTLLRVCLKRRRGAVSAAGRRGRTAQGSGPAEFFGEGTSADDGNAFTFHNSLPRAAGSPLKVSQRFSRSKRKLRLGWAGFRAHEKGTRPRRYGRL